ncbi:MAG: hypothetical protein DGJ47_001052 [Rickettsiaceae bacterium]
MFNKKILLASGLVTGLIFAPVYFILGLFGFSILAKHIKHCHSSYQAAVSGYIFGFGFFLSSLYWISFSIFVYIEEFWWAFPFALIGLPMFLALFYGAFSYICFHFKHSNFYHLIFCILLLITEWFISWSFSGLPWAMAGYAFCFSDILLQSASIFGIFGLSFIAIYIGSMFYAKQWLQTRFIMSLALIASMTIYGHIRLNNFPTEYTDIKVRIIQPSVQQQSKWSPKDFWQNLERQVTLSSQENDGATPPDIIIWSEAALTVPYNNPLVYSKLKQAFVNPKQILIIGTVSEEIQQQQYKIYSSMIALNSSIEELFSYYKSHLVPFGEYIPLKNFLPIKKLTAGAVDYSKGTRKILNLNQHHLKIHPLICYESIFSHDVLINNQDADVIINITNDAWYGNSSGPYQHFAINKVRAIEMGLPMLRSANNGISAIIDPLGRTVQKTSLNEVIIVENQIPAKLSESTYFSNYSFITTMLLILLVTILQLMLYLIYKKSLF